MHPARLLLAAALLCLAPCHPAPAQTPTVTPPDVTAASPPDLSLLRRALAPLGGEGVLLSRSTLQMTGAKQGVSFTFREDIHVVARRPGRFRAEITQFPGGGRPPLRLLVVSDGVQVWTYRPGLARYSVISLAAFHAADSDLTALGLAVGGFYLGDGHDMARGLAGITKSTSPQALALFSQMGIEIAARAESADNEDDIVYRMALTKQGLAYAFFVSPSTGALRRLDLTGAQNGVSLAFRETVHHVSTPASLPKDTFQFVPPPHTALVPTLSVDPF